MVCLLWFGLLVCPVYFCLFREEKEENFVEEVQEEEEEEHYSVVEEVEEKEDNFLEEEGEQNYFIEKDFLFLWRIVLRRRRRNM